MNELEMCGLDILKKMEFECFGDLGHIRIAEVFPHAAVTHNEHFEFDYFVLYGDKCLVGEISGISDESEIKRKYKTFRYNYGFLHSAKDTAFFHHFNIPRQ